MIAQVAPGGTDSGAASLPKLVLPHVEYHLLVPVLILIGSAVVLLGAASLTRDKWPRGTYAAWTAATGVATMVWAWHLWGQIVGHHRPRAGAVGAHPVAAVAHAVAVDGFSLFLILVIGSTLVLGALVAESYLPREGLEGPEYYILAMLCAAGAVTMAEANDLIVVFLGLEILSISLYVLTGYHLKRSESGEAAIKYFVLGAFSSAFFLYGVALVYGATGSTNLGAIASFLATNDLTSNGVLLAGSMLLLVGLGFKVAAVPFHVWTPDVYQGAPTPATGFMAAMAKAAGFAALLRVLLSALPTQSTDWQIPVGALCALTLLVGAVLAVVQDDVKRMMAYSSVSHAGYVLLGLWAASQQGSGGSGGTPAGLAGSLFYLLAYTFMIVGTFAVITVVGGRGDRRHQVDNYRGLARQRPALALGFTILLLSQAGIPFTTGFFAKFYVIGAAVALGTTWGYVLGVVAMMAAVIATFFYLRVILACYSTPEGAGQAAGEAGGEGAGGVGTSGGGVAVAERTVTEAGVAVGTPARVAVPASITLALVLSVAFTVAFGLAPGPIVHLAEKATLLF